MARLSQGFEVAAIASLTIVLLGQEAWAQSPSCFDSMETPGTCLPWGYTDLQQQIGSNRVAVDISKDGSALATVNNPGFGVARWRLDTGLDIYSPPSGLTNPFLTIDAPVLSADGSFIVGRGVFSSATRAFRWEVASDT